MRRLEKVRGKLEKGEEAHGQSWVPFFGSIYLVVKAKFDYVHVCEWYSCETIGTEKYQTVWLALVTCKTAKQTANMKDFWEDKQLKTSTTPHCHSNRLILPLVCTGTLHIKCYAYTVNGWFWWQSSGVWEWGYSLIASKPDSYVVDQW